MKRFTLSLLGALSICGIATAEDKKAAGKYNILFMISDDLTAEALGSYGNKVCKTPNIDALASEGTLYEKSYCQYPVCGPSRASMMSGYYPDATRMYGYASGRAKIGDERQTWPQYFKDNGYYTARVSKIYHMGVPGDIEKGTDGTDDPASWTARYNSQGPEVFCAGEQLQLVKNPEAKPVSEVTLKGGNTQEICIAEGDDLVHSDGKTAEKASELIRELKDQRFFLAVGFVRPHIPFVAPKKYFDMYPWLEMTPVTKMANDWDDIPKVGINYRTGQGMQLSEKTEKMSLMGYYASTTFMDAQVGKVMQTLKEEGLEDETIVIFTSDHGFHLGEHDFWQKVGLMEESSRVPLIIKVPGQKPVVCNSFTELIDLYPTTAALCGLEIPKNIQGKDLSKTITDGSHKVRDFAFSRNNQGRESYLIRSDKWAFIQHGPNGDAGGQLFNMAKDPKQFNNLYDNPEYAKVVAEHKAKLADKLKEVQTNDLGIDYSAISKKKKKKKKK